MRTILAILAIGLFSLTANAQDYQLCGSASGIDVCLTMDTQSRDANVVICPVLATNADDCLVFLGTFDATGQGLNVVITFTNKLDGTTVNFYHQGYDRYVMYVEGKKLFLDLVSI